jgi:Zn-dependent M16 (insulinase) family peptidase
MDMHGFSTVADRDLDLIGVHGRLLRHDASGAELLALPSAEPNLSFAVGFPTLPDDDTGVAHILEHMVLAGSERFPLKDPFFEMIKSSLAGFLNAMTYPDRTVYPFATEHPRDFLNLLDVYLDAVFRPRLSRETFDQEAWHLEPGEAPGSLRLRGVVYNEMKGAMADPNRALSHAETAALLPATAYRHESGGDPAAIPELSHEALKAYHAAHYHPSRARFVVHGDVPLEATLAALAGYLDGTPRLEPLPAPAVQPPFDAPREAHAVYPADDRGKALATVAWALPAPSGPDELLALELLEHVLVGSPAAPLRRALLDAGLGEAFVGGLGTAMRQPLFRAGLRGVEEGRAAEVHETVLSTLRDLAERGVDATDVEAARNRMEFELRELDVYGGQRGLALALDALGAWLHGRDPLEQLDFGAALDGLDRRLEGDAAAVTELLRDTLLANPHRVHVRVEPDAELSERRAREEEARLAARAARLDEAGHADVARAAERLEAHQRRPDPPEARARLPRLRRDDLREARPDPELRSEERAGAEVVHVLQPTRGLVYLDLGFDLRRLPDRLLPHAGLLGRLLLETGTARRSLAELTRAIDRDTGGIGAALELAPGIDGAPGVARFFLRGRALADKAGALADLMREVLVEADLNDPAKLRRLAVEDLARRRAALEPAGHRYALRRLAAHASEEGRAEERLAGLASLDELARFAKRCDDDWTALRDELEELRARLLVRSGLVAGVTADEAADRAATAALPALLDGLPAGDHAAPGWRLDPPAPREGWTLPGQVHYVGTGRVLNGGGPLPGSWLAAARWLTSDVLIPRVRFQGGAYGAGALLDPLRGALRTYSYRDPNLKKTLDTVAEAPALLREAAEELDDTEFESLVIGSVGSLDPYALPGARGYRALVRRLRGSEGQVARLRADLLAADRGAFHALADAIEAAAEPVLVVLGPRPSLEAQRDDLGLHVREPG